MNETDGMTALTPQHMRELADLAEMLQGDSDYDYVFVTNVMTALRTAADEQERQKEHIKALQRLAKGRGYEADNFREKYRTAANQLEAVQTVLAEAHDKFAATYDAERMTGRGPSSIGVAGAPLASSVQRALGLLRAKATANIERLTAETASQEDRDECGVVTESSAGPLVCTAPRGHNSAHNTEGTI